jgi:disulfide oxidoreductase YuzD
MMRIQNHASFMYIYISVDILVYKDHNDNNDIIGKILNDDYITTSTIVIMMKISIMRIRMNRMIR